MLVPRKDSHNASLDVGATEGVTLCLSLCLWEGRNDTTSLLMLVSGKDSHSMSLNAAATKASHCVSLDVGATEGLTVRLSLCGFHRRFQTACLSM